MAKTRKSKVKSASLTAHDIEEMLLTFGLAGTLDDVEAADIQDDRLATAWAAAVEAIQVMRDVRHAVWEEEEARGITEP